MGKFKIGISSMGAGLNQYAKEESMINIRIVQDSGSNPNDHCDFTCNFTAELTKFIDDFSKKNENVKRLMSRGEFYEWLVKEKLIEK